ncbi:hypothetical protein TNCT_614101 [Trichonephila clavata]|uniref:Uncharacterized protein n=1 Tax=Trichonephila clavata TaxID=2740835 RepID=A0A8X6HSV9_TRICU|nr:hypothetical protein TNCT_614101 [Trichonephila clavata]
MASIRQVRWFLETKELFHHALASFNECRSTKEQAAFFSQSIKDKPDRFNIVYVAFVDLKEPMTPSGSQSCKTNCLETRHWQILHLSKEFLIQCFKRQAVKQLLMGLYLGAVSNCMPFTTYFDDIISTLVDKNINILIYTYDIVL